MDLVSLLVYVLIFVLVGGLIIYLIDLLPVDGTLKQVARVVLILILLLVLVLRFLPGVNLPLR